jgi:hypothetical protein
MSSNFATLPLEVGIPFTGRVQAMYCTAEAARVKHSNSESFLIKKNNPYILL